VISHSEDALQRAREALPKHHHVVALHPIRDSQLTSAKTATPSVVVAGQFKPERDIQLLRALGPSLRSRGIDARIVGRGWPAVDGWRVDSRFLSESELDTTLASAWLVLLPYKMYFQSGILIRALELGTLTISPETSFARDVLPREFVIDATASATDWLGAIERALQGSARPIAPFTEYQVRVDRSWELALSRIAESVV
jgi:hypothetical protein